MPKNPFEVLGLTPELVGDLSEKQLKAVLKTMYRVLQKTFHPDVAASAGAGPPAEQRAIELNLAYDSLDFDRDPAGFRRMRKSYLARRPSAALREQASLRGQLEAQAEREAALAENFFKYLEGACAPMLGDRGEISSPLPAKGVRLGLLDVAINNNVRQASWLTGSNYKLMEFDEGGLLRVKGVGRGRFSRSNYIHPLGCVPSQSIDLGPVLERTCAQSYREMASFPSNPRPKLKVLNLISLDNFKRHALPLLLPLLLERAYLFSISEDEYKKTGLITVEGLIVKLDRI